MQHGIVVFFFTCQNVAPYSVDRAILGVAGEDAAAAAEISQAAAGGESCAECSLGDARAITWVATREFLQVEPHISDLLHR